MIGKLALAGLGLIGLAKAFGSHGRSLGATHSQHVELVWDFSKASAEHFKEAIALTKSKKCRLAYLSLRGGWELLRAAEEHHLSTDADGVVGYLPDLEKASRLMEKADKAFQKSCRITSR